MKTLEDQMSFYAAYHQDARNKATHFVGVPVIAECVETKAVRDGLEALGAGLAQGRAFGKPDASFAPSIL